MERQLSPSVRKAPLHQSFVRPRTAGHATRTHALLQLQRNVGNQRLAECMKSKDLLPGGVGVVESINQEVALTEILGRSRAELEQQIRDSNDAREFVCEQGLPAMLALFYNRDYKNRLDVPKARERFAAQPRFYSIRWFETDKLRKRFFKEIFGIVLQPGDKEWSPEDIALLGEALRTLDTPESPLIRGYRFVRWTSRCNELRAQDPNYQCRMDDEQDDYSTCGLHLTDVITRDKSITMYDCYIGASNVPHGSKVKPGADTIIHEIGHAMEFGRVRLALERQQTAKREYDRLSRQAAAARGAKQVALTAAVAAAKKALDAADNDLKAAMSPSALEEFEKLVKGKTPLTPYSRKNSTEAFAEAYMLFKIAPDTLKKANKPLFEWFDRGGYR
jgi:hypothetical protein